MEINGIKLLTGYHLTATERKAIVSMLKNGYHTARNKPNTKTYTVTSGNPAEREYSIEISTFATVTIGRGPEWRKSQFTIKAI